MNRQFSEEDRHIANRHIKSAQHNEGTFKSGRQGDITHTRKMGKTETVGISVLAGNPGSGIPFTVSENVVWVNPG